MSDSEELEGETLSSGMKTRMRAEILNINFVRKPTLFGPAYQRIIN